MRKSNKGNKNFLKNRSKKIERLRVRFKRRKALKNKMRSRRRKENPRSTQLKNRFPGYEIIKAPTRFSITKNTEEVLSFVNKLEKCLKSRKKVFVDLSDVQEIAHGAIVILLSIMIKFRSCHIDFNGNFPINKSAKRVLLDSNFIEELLHKKHKIINDSYAVCRDKILTHAQKVVDSKLSDSIITEISTLIWGEPRRCTGLQRVYIELMQNTNNHASPNGKGVHHWWTTVQYDPLKKKAYFSFLDYGIGIIQSLNTDKRSKFYSVVQLLKSQFSIISDAKLLMLLLNGDLHKTSTGDYFRGKGLPCLFEACDKNQISNVVVITNKAKVEYHDGNKSEINIKGQFNGTFIFWELNYNNKNIYYES